MAQVKTLNDLDFRPRLILGAEGEKGSGKTALLISAALSRPPVSLMRFDFASEGVLRYAKKLGLSDLIHLRDYDIDMSRDLADQAFQAKEAARLADTKSKDRMKTEADKRVEQVISGAEKQAAEFEDDYKAALAMEGTVILDTFTEVYDLERLAVFGQLKQVLQLFYEKSNKKMLHLINLAEESSSNLIVLNKLRDDWADGGDGKKRRTGRMIVDGWDKLEYPVHAMVRMFRRGSKSDPERVGPPGIPGEFCMQFLKCNDKEEDDLTGTVHAVPSPLVGFDMIGKLIFGEEWDS